MANVQQYVEQILSARFGEEVRGSIANSILAMNDEAVEAHDVAIDSQTSSQKNAQAAALSATNAKDSETKAKTSELNAKDSETKAKASEVNAKTSEDNAKASELASKVSETNAKTSEGNAKTSETNAKTSETSANDSMRSALQSASSASASASAASASQTASANSASAAKVSEDNARQYAQQASSIANIDVATVSRNGISRPDGSTIGINQFGVLSALGVTEHINTNLDDENGVHGTRIYTIPETGKQILQKWDEESSDWVDVAGALDPATKDTIGGVIVGDNINVDNDGKISVPKASKSAPGAVKIGDGIDVNDGTISANFGNVIEYNEDDSILYLKNGESVLAQVEISGVTPATIVHVTTTEDSWKGNPDVTISLSDGENAYTGTFDENGDYSHKVKNLGEHTAIVTDSGKTYTGTVDVTTLGGTFFINIEKIANGKTVTPINDVPTWLSCIKGGTAHSYTTLDEVIADTTLLSNILASDNANDYLVRSTDFATTLCNNQTAMTFIGNINACADKLLADSTWLTAICNSTYFEKVLNVKVPTMTSNTTPYGVASCDVYFTNLEAYKAFDGAIGVNQRWGSLKDTLNSWVGYKFINNIKVNAISLTVLYTNDRSILANPDTTFYIEADNSLDFTNPITLKEFNLSETQMYKNVNVYFENNSEFLCYRIRSSKNTHWYVGSGEYHDAYTSISELQFYGREGA